MRPWDPSDVFGKNFVMNLTACQEELIAMALKGQNS